MITWLLQSYADLTAPPTAWLSAAEQAEYTGLQVEKRRQDWLAGRWTAKRLIQATRPGLDGVALDEIRISPASGHAPLAHWPGSAQGWPLSLSHCNGQAVAALSDEACEPLGIDLERVEVRSPGFADDYFTLAELESLGRELEGQAEQVTAIWCAKEAALKSLNLGLTVDTRAVSVWLDRTNSMWQGWRRLEVDVVGFRLRHALSQDLPDLHGWWRRHGPYLLAIVTGAPNMLAAGWPVEVRLAGLREKVA